jgi:hypothetical protein
VLEEGGLQNGELAQSEAGVLRRLCDEVEMEMEAAGRRLEEAPPFPPPRPWPGSHFPALPLLRGLPAYAVLPQKTSAKDLCNKTAGSHPNLCAGLLVFSCPHCVIIGYEPMRGGESPAAVFRVLLQRFPAPPALVCYDNACKAYDYMANREPAWFRKTQWIVDCFHSRNHRSCSRDFLATTHTNPDISRLNTSGPEQINAQLGRLSRSLAYTKPALFHRTLRAFIALLNRSRRQS